LDGTYSMAKTGVNPSLSDSMKNFNVD